MTVIVIVNLLDWYVEFSLIHCQRAKKVQLAVVGLQVPGAPQDQTASKESLVQLVLMDAMEIQDCLVHQEIG